MMKNIKDYLHLYLGCKVVLKGDKQFQFRHTLISINKNGLVQTYIQQAFENSSTNFFNIEYVTPVLRRLSDMTQEEAKWIIDNTNLRAVTMGGTEKEFAKALAERWSANSNVLFYLLKQGFWIFGNEWFDEGLIIDNGRIQ